LRGARILVVEDDPSIRLGLRMNLEREGYLVETAEDGEGGLERARAASWDLIILDVMLPRLNGYELLVTLRAERREASVLVLSARGSDVDKVMGLDLGAEDYVTKPFSLPELLARVRAALRRRAELVPAAVSSWRFGDVVIEPETRVVRKAGEAVVLTATEFDVLAALVRARGRVLSRDAIFEAVWGPGHHGSPRTVDNFVAQLRAKLEDDPAEPRHLLTVRGVGYRLVDGGG
jgi:DNA-binding response OmpR family regulator